MGRHIGSVASGWELVRGDLGLVRTCWRKSAPRELSEAEEWKRAGRELGLARAARTGAGEVERRSRVMMERRRRAMDIPRRRMDHILVDRLSPALELERAREAIVIIIG